jgi:hypothetical protein
MMVRAGAESLPSPVALFARQAGPSGLVLPPTSEGGRQSRTDSVLTVPWLVLRGELLGLDSRNARFPLAASVAAFVLGNEQES